MGATGTIPIAVVASGTGGSSLATAFTFGTASGSLALLNSQNYQLQIVSGSGVTPGFYPVTNWAPAQFASGWNVGAPPTFGPATTATLSTSPGSTGTGITWNLILNVPFVPQGQMSYPVDASGYPLNQAGGLAGVGGVCACASPAVAYQLSTSSIPCKQVIVAPSTASGASASVTLVVGTSSAGVLGGQGISLLTTYSSGAIHTQPAPAVMQVSDVSQIWVKSSLANDTIGFEYFV